MEGNRRIAIFAVAAVSAAAVPALPAPAEAEAEAAVVQRELEGTVVSVDRATRTFRLRDSERGTFRIRVTSRTRFERVAGFQGLRRGMTRIEATVRRARGGWTATEVERSGGGGRHGGDDD
jgi:hypothetical protein